MATLNILDYVTNSALYILWYVAREGEVVDAGAIRRKDMPDAEETKYSFARVKQDKYAWDIDVNFKETPEDFDLRNTLKWIEGVSRSDDNFVTWDVDVWRGEDVCPRCGGTGYIPQFSHIQNGVCFRCAGSGVADDVYKSGIAHRTDTKQLELDM